MDDQLKLKLLANDNISLEIEDFETHENESNFSVQSYRSLFKRTADSKRALSAEMLPINLELTWENVVVTVTENAKQSWCAQIGNCLGSKSGKQQTPTKRHHILDGVSGVAKAGEILAIMGGSGAGKTTLLNVLTQRNLEGVRAQGSIKANGLTLKRRDIHCISAYVQQNDLFIGTMTVSEHLHFMVKMRTGHSFSAEEQEQRVRDVIKDLDLTHCTDTLIGWPHRLKGISGGERKRLAFASEILMSPPLLFCDEPTSGLDAFLARQVVRVLKDLAKKKSMTIVFTIHQPSSQIFELFDRLFLLANGQVAFTGTTEQAIQHWCNIGHPLPQNFNPADHFIASLCTNSSGKHDAENKIQEMCDAFKRSEFAKEIWNSVGKHSSNEFLSALNANLNYSITYWQKHRAPWLQQFVALTKRSFMITMREPMLLKVRFTQTVVSALLLGIIYFDTPIRQSTIMNINGLLYQSSINMNFLFQFASVDVFCGEYPVFMREHLDGVYGVGTYFLAKNVAESAQYVLYPTVFSAILYWMSGLYRTFDAFVLYTFNLLLMTNVSISIAYMFACIFARVNIAIAVLPIFVIPLLAFGGFFINQSTLPAYFLPLRFLSYFGFVYENLAINEWERINWISGCSQLSQNSTCLRTGNDVLRSQGFSRADFLPNTLLLVAMLVVFRLLAALALVLRAAQRK